MHKKIKCYVCASDELYSIKSREFICIVNSDKCFEPGTHWLCFLKKRNENLQFFDSIGLPFEFYGEDFVSFVTRVNLPVEYSSIRVQSSLSSLCGEYCLYFVLKRMEGLDFHSVLSTLSNSFHMNDVIVLQSLQKILKKDQICARHTYRSSAFQTSKHLDLLKR